MTVSNLFYRRPRLTLLTVCLILVAGLTSWAILPRLEDPVLLPRFATINTPFPGAAPDRVESQVTSVIEEELEEFEEISVLTSTSAFGVSMIQVELADRVTDVTDVWTRIRDKLNDLQIQLPRDAQPPQFEELDTRAVTMIIGLTWEQPGPVRFGLLRRRAEHLQERLLALPGTQKVELFGDPAEEVLVEIDPVRLASLGLTAAELSAQLRDSDAKLAAGQLRSNASNLLLEVDSRLRSLERIRRTPIRYGDGTSFVRLEDIARVHKDIAHPMAEYALLDGKPGIALSTFVLPHYRIDIWSVEAKQLLADYFRELPGGLGLTLLFDQSVYTEQRLHGLTSSLLLGALAVLVVVLLLMGWQSALLVGLALPLSALMVLSGMRFLGIPIHQMSVTGLIIALGLLIDNAIVMVHEVTREMRGGIPAPEAVSGSVSKLALPLFGSTVTTVLAFMPIALMPGPAGEFVGAIALSVILALIGSLFLAMTIVPTLTGFLQPSGESSPGASPLCEGLQFPRVQEAYRSSLRWLFRHPWRGLILGLILPAAGFGVGWLLPEQFFPPADRDQFQIEVELPAQASLEQTKLLVSRMNEMLTARDRIDAVHWFVGKSAPAFYYNLMSDREFAPQYAQALVQLDSPEGAEPLIRRLQLELDAAFPSARVLVRQLEQGPPFPAPVELRLYGPDLKELHRLGEEFRRELVSLPEVIHTRTSLNDARPKLGLAINEEELRLTGLSNAAVSRLLDTTLEGIVGGSILEETEELPIRVRVADDRRGDLDRVMSLDLVPPGTPTDSSAEWIPLSAIADIKLQPQVAAITRRNGRRVNQVQAFVTAGVLPATVFVPFEQRIRPLLASLPAGYSHDFGGEASKRDDAVGNLMSSVGILMVIMVATLVLSFSSFRMAGIIGAVGACSVGVGLFALWAFGYPFGFMAIVGTMGLVGVAINDSIVVLAALRSHRVDAATKETAAEVVFQETRHVLATTLTTIAGFVPLLISGGGFWPPLAIAIAGGVSGATVLALYFAPSLYLILMCSSSPAERLAARLGLRLENAAVSRTSG
jgi:multidrug efflux pump